MPAKSDVEGRSSLVAYLRGIRQCTNGTSTLLDVVGSGLDDQVLAFQGFGVTVDGEERFFDVTSVMHLATGGSRTRSVAASSRSTSPVPVTVNGAPHPPTSRRWR